MVSRLGLFAHLDEAGTPAEVYRHNLEVFTFAERLGIDTAWVAVRHFRSALAGLPAAFPFLAALSQRTSRIGLGVAVVPLAFEHPIRVAEDASVLDALSGGRVELGVGKGLGMGLSDESFAAFGIDKSARADRYDRSLEALRATLGGVPVTTTGSTLWPPAEGLAGRLWQATSSDETTINAARAGDALMLHRSAAGIPGKVQAGQIELYLDNLAPEVDVRIGISRALIPARDRTDALQLLRESLAEASQRSGRADPPRTLGEVETFAIRGNVKYGSPADIVEQLSGDDAVSLSTDLIVGFSPLIAHGQVALDLIDVVARQIAPSLGWSPQHELRLLA